MCLGGGSSAPAYKPIQRVDPPPGPPSPQDMVNNQAIENANPRDQQEAKRQANRGPTASSQSAKITNKAY